MHSLLIVSAFTVSTPTTLAGFCDIHSVDSSIKVRSMLSARHLSSSSDDPLNGDCAAVSVIFARGTTETGNIGTIVDPRLDNLHQVLGEDNVAFQGVDDTANIAGFLAGGDDDGAATMADLATQAISDCPGTQLVLSGYR
jgi:cutinase